MVISISRSRNTAASAEDTITNGSTVWADVKVRGADSSDGGRDAVGPVGLVSGEELITVVASVIVLLPIAVGMVVVLAVLVVIAVAVAVAATATDEAVDVVFIVLVGRVLSTVATS